MISDLHALIKAYHGSNLSTTGPLVGEGRKWLLWPDGRHGEVGGNMPFFLGEYNMFIVPSSFLPSLCNNGNPIINDI